MTMRMQATVMSVDDVARADARRARAMLPGAILLAGIAGLIAAELAAQRNPVGAVLLPLLAVPVILWRWPQLGVYVSLGSAVVIEQFPYRFAHHQGPFTQKIPLFQSIVRGTGVSPIEILLLVVMLIWLLKGALAHTLNRPRSPLAVGITAYLVVVLVYLGLGLARHGHVKIALWEVRPWFYIGIMYLFTSSMLATEGAWRVAQWIFVLGNGFKGVLGDIAFLQVEHMKPRPQAILAHEASFFLGLFLLYVVALWLFGIKGRLRRVATFLVPFVVLADAGNSRRTAWAILGLGMMGLVVVAAFRAPERRKKGVRWFAAALTVLSVLYIAAFWNHGGTLGSPARAVHSAIHPSARDKASNQYRVIEDENLVVNIRAYNSTGEGFGLPIDYAITITNLTNIDSAISFIPHNGVLWVWMRTGVVGETLLWFMILAAMIRSGDLLRAPDTESVLLGAFAICSIISYVTMGYYDMGFFWFRLAFFMGITFGLVEARLRYLARQQSVLPGDIPVPLLPEEACA